MSLETRTWKIESWQGTRMTKKQSRKDRFHYHIQAYITSETQCRCVAEVATVVMALSPETRRDHATMKAEQSLESRHLESLEEGTCHTRVACR
jgi:hypothetical protein